MSGTSKGGGGGGSGSGGDGGVAGSERGADGSPAGDDRARRSANDAGEIMTGETPDALSLAERRVRALEDIAEAMRGVRGHLVDVSLWLAHIGRNLPPDLRR